MQYETSYEIEIPNYNISNIKLTTQQYHVTSGLAT